MTSTPKVTVSIFWSPPGLSVITVLLPITKFTVAHFCHGFIPKIVEGMPFEPVNSPRQLMLHIDNANPH
jgi:hypothetical protein